MSIRNCAPLLAAGASLAGLTGLVLVLAAWILEPSLQDFLSLGLFLLISGGATLFLGWVAPRFGPVRLFHSLRSKLLLLVTLVSALGLANVAFTSYLMFISAHDVSLLLVLLIFSLGVSISLAFVLTSPFTVTIRAVLDAVNRMRAGQLDTRLAVATRDELEEVASAFNSMAAELERAFRRQRELESARHDLIVAVSHDLRSPLASIRAMVESINDGVVSDRETIQRYLLAVQKEVGFLSQLIDDLFEISQINAGLLTLQLDWGSLQDVISDTLVSISAQAAQRGLRVEGTVDEDLRPVLMDTRRVQRVLLNFLQNALRHTPCDGTVCISADDLGSEVCVQVSDTGEGIPPQELPHIFEAFYRGDRARSHDASGGGLGLSIAQGIIEAHGGRIWAESAPGQGSRFFFTLPRSDV